MRDQGEFLEDVEVHGSPDRICSEAGAGCAPVAEVCRKAGVADATFYSWRKKYAGLMPSEMKRLRQLEDENARLKRVVADLTLDRAVLQAGLVPVLRRSPISLCHLGFECEGADAAQI